MLIHVLTASTVLSSLVLSQMTDAHSYHMLIQVTEKHGLKSEVAACSFA